MSFTIKPSTRVLFEMAWQWKHGEAAPRCWSDDEMLKWIRTYDEECRIANEREDAQETAGIVQEAADNVLARAHEPPAPLPIPEGLPSLGGLILRAKFDEDVREPESQPEEPCPTAASRLSGQ